MIDVTYKYYAIFNFCIHKKTSICLLFKSRLGPEICLQIIKNIYGTQKLYIIL